MSDRDSDRATRVYVGGLSESIKKEDLELEFEKFGKLNSVWVAFNPPGFAFIEFNNLSDAETACDNLNGTDFLGSKLRVEIARGRSRRGGFRGGRGSRRGGSSFRGGYDRERSFRGGRGGSRGGSRYDSYGSGGGRRDSSGGRFPRGGGSRDFRNGDSFRRGGGGGGRDFSRGRRSDGESRFRSRSPRR